MKKTLYIILIAIISILIAITVWLYVNTKETTETKNVEIKEIGTTTTIKPRKVKVIEEKTPQELFAEEYEEKMKEFDETPELDYKQWYLSYKEMISRHKNDYEDTPETIYDYYTESELDILFRVVQAEIGDEYTFIQKCNVASVIFNRVSHEKFGDEIHSVLNGNQFATISNGRYNTVEVSQDTILACEFAFEIMDTTGGCVFFDSDGSLNYQFIFNDGAHNFYKLKEDK